MLNVLRLSFFLTTAKPTKILQNFFSSMRELLGIIKNATNWVESKALSMMIISEEDDANRTGFENFVQ